MHAWLVERSMHLYDMHGKLTQLPYPACVSAKACWNRWRFSGIIVK